MNQYDYTCFADGYSYSICIRITITITITSTITAYTITYSEYFLYKWSTDCKACIIYSRVGSVSCISILFHTPWYYCAQCSSCFNVNQVLEMKSIQANVTMSFYICYQLYKKLFKFKKNVFYPNNSQYILSILNNEILNMISTEVNLSRDCT